MSDIKMPAQIISNRLIVKYHENSEALWDALEQYGEIIAVLSQLKRLTLHLSAEFASQHAEIKSALSEREDVDYVAYDQKFREKPYSAVTDPLHFVYANDLIARAVRAPEAWEITKGRADVIGCFTDTGVDYDSPDLQDSLLPMMWSTESVDGPLALSGETYPKRLDLVQAIYWFSTYSNFGGEGIPLNARINIYPSSIVVPPELQETTVVYLDEACTQPVEQPIYLSQHTVVWVTHPISVSMLYDIGSNVNTSNFFGMCPETVGDLGAHGTGTLGIPAAAHNGQGVAGMAPDCKYYMLNTVTATATAYMAAFIFAAHFEGTAAINCSWGSSEDWEAWRDGFAYVHAATDTEGVNKEIIVISASGNYSADGAVLDAPSYPGQYPEIIDVSGTTFRNNDDNAYPFHKANFATRADSVFISAPATDFLVLSPFDPRNGIWGRDWYNMDSDFFEYRYARYGGMGTSYAAPIVHGCAMLMKSEAKNLGMSRLTRSQFRTFVKEAAEPEIWDTRGNITFDTQTLGPMGNPAGGMGWGVIDYCRSLKALRGEIDVRIRKKLPVVVAGVASPLVKIDVRTWGAGISSVEVYANDALIQTFNPSGLSYVATPNITIAQTGLAIKVHCKAYDIGGSIFTSTPIYVDAVAAHKPLVEAVTYPDPEVSGAQYANMGFPSEMYPAPVVMYADLGNKIKLRMSKTFGAVLTYSNVKMYIDDVLVLNSNGPFTPSSSGTVEFQIVPPVAVGYHTLRVELYAGTAVDVKEYSLIYGGEHPRGLCLSKPFTYKNGILEVEVYAQGGTAAYDPTGTGEFHGVLGDILLRLDGVAASDMPYVLEHPDKFYRFRLQVPKPTLVEIVVLSIYDLAVWSWETNRLEGWEYAGETLIDTFTIPEAPGNDPSVDVNPPIAFSSLPGGKYAPGREIKLDTYRSRPGATIKYRWVP